MTTHRAHPYRDFQKPPRLSPGDRIAVVSVAGEVEAGPVEAGMQVLKELGWVPVIWEGCFDRVDGFAGTDRQRAERFLKAWEDPDVRAVWAARGGYGSMRMLRHIDYERLQARPKVLVGFSDVTALHAAILRHCRIVTFHGPLMTTLAETTTTARQWMSAMLTGQEPSAFRVDSIDILHSGAASGPLFAANLATLCHLLGTPYFPNLDGHLLVVEDVGESWHRVDRMFLQLMLSGVLERLSGVLIGSFRNCGSHPERILRTIQEIGTKLDIPVAAGFPLGHQEDNRMIPNGVWAQWDSETKAFRLLETPTST